MADPAPAGPPSTSAPAPGSLTGTRYDAPISDAQFDRLGPESQSKYARVRDQNNNPTWQPRSDLTPDPAVAPKPAAAPGEPPAPAAPASVTEDGKLKVGELELSADDVAALMATKAQADLRATQVPATAADYKPDLPADLQLPPGIEFKIDVSDPSYKDLANFAHARGWSQSDLSTALGIFAAIKRARPRRLRRRNVRKSRNSAPMAHRASLQWRRGCDRCSAMSSPTRCGR